MKVVLFEEIIPTKQSKLICNGLATCVFNGIFICAMTEKVPDFVVLLFKMVEFSY